MKKELLADPLKTSDFRVSFRIAVKGIAYLFMHHRNMRFIFLLGLMAILLGFYANLTSIELIALSITVTLVFMAEILNTAIELMLDAITKDYHHKIKLVKDISAGVVVITCANAALIGYVLFIRKLFINN